MGLNQRFAPNSSPLEMVSKTDSPARDEIERRGARSGNGIESWLRQGLLFVGHLFISQPLEPAGASWARGGMADTKVLGAFGASLAGSSPVAPTKFFLRFFEDMVRDPFVFPSGSGRWMELFASFTELAVTGEAFRWSQTSPNDGLNPGPAFLECFFEFS